MSLARSIDHDDVAAAGRHRLAWTALWCLFIGHLICAAVVLPPWQNLAEPIHFAKIRALALFDTPSDSQYSAVQSEVLASMAEHGWWRAYSEAVPDPVPRTFAEVPTHLGDATTARLTFYYVAAARYCRVLGLENLFAQFFACRVASLLLMLGTMLFVVRGAREWFDENTAYVASAIVALLPQFALVGISVSPDPLVFALGAFVWWQAGRLMARKAVVAPMVLIVAATTVAVVAKQLG